LKLHQPGFKLHRVEPHHEVQQGLVRAAVHEAAQRPQRRHPHLGAGAHVANEWKS